MKKPIEIRKIVQNLCFAGLISLAANPVLAGPDAVKIGLLMDMSGNYSDVAGKGSVTAAEMAVTDFGGKVLNKPVKILFADMQNKVDIATSIAREWFDEDDVDAILDSNMSSAGLAVSQIAAEKGKIMAIKFLVHRVSLMKSVIRIPFTMSMIHMH